jgi:mRNA interferase MazF
MKRGEFVTIATQGDYGKPRPALVIQADAFRAHSSATVLPITSKLIEAPLLRVTIQPNSENGLKQPSQVMIDKTITVKREKLGPAFGQIDSHSMTQIERCLAIFLGIAK